MQDGTKSEAVSWKLSVAFFWCFLVMLHVFVFKLFQVLTYGPLWRSGAPSTISKAFGILFFDMAWYLSQDPFWHLFCGFSFENLKKYVKNNTNLSSKMTWLKWSG